MAIKAFLCAVAFLLTGSAIAEPVTIRYACTAGGDNLKLLKKSVAEFEAEHPNIRVKVEPVVSDSYENKLLAMLAANTAPDVATLNPNRFVAFAARKALKPLNDFSDLEQADLDGRYPNIVKAFSYEGKQYAIPRDIACSAFIFYNKKIFRDAGIPYPDGTWTWDTKVRPELRERDFIWVMQQLTKRKPGTNRPYQYGFATAWPQLWMSTLLASSDVKMWDSDSNPSKLFLDDPKVVDVFRFAADCLNKHHWMPSSTDVALGSGSTMQNEFRKGNIAMLQSGTWEIREMRPWKGDWDLAPFPKFARNATRILPGEGAGLAVFASSKHPQEAWEWIKWYCGPKGLTPMAQSGESMPSIRALAQQEGVWMTAKDEPPANLAISDEMATQCQYKQLPDWFAGIQNDLQGSFYGVLSGEKTADVVLANLQRDEPNKLALAKKRVNAPDYPFQAGLAIGIALVLVLIAWIYAPEIRKKRTAQEKVENRSAYLFLIPWLFGIALTVGPMIYSLLLSFADSDIIQTPKWRGLGNYADILNPAIDDTLWVSLRQTFYYAFLSLPLGVAVALALSLLLNQKVKGVPLFRALYYLPSLASAVAMSLIWQRLFDKDRGVINMLLYGSDGTGAIGNWISDRLGIQGDQINWLGSTQTVLPAFVIMGLWGAGGGTIIFLAGLQGISTTYYEAATLDGAGAWRRFRNVTLPMITPYIFFSLITGVIGAMQVFSQSVVLTQGGPDRSTLFMVVWLYGKAFGELKMGYASAIAWILFIVILAFTLLQLAAARKWVYYEGEVK